MKDANTTLLRATDEKIRKLVKRVDPKDLAAHNAGYAPSGNLYEQLIVPERGRYPLALQMIDHLPPGRAVDLGCFFPYMPILLTQLGWEVTAVERYSMFGPSLHQALSETAAAEGFGLLDLDMITDLDRVGGADLVLLMAVVEHFNGSPLSLVRGIRNLLTPRDGHLLLEVPNIATLWQRFQFLRGVSPLPDYRTFLQSSYPFTGHNREMTVGEVQLLLNEAGMVIDDIKCFDYSPATLGIKPAMLRFLQRAFPSCRETIMAVAHPGGR